MCWSCRGVRDAIVQRKSFKPCGLFCGPPSQHPCHIVLALKLHITHFPLAYLSTPRPDTILAPTTLSQVWRASPISCSCSAHFSSPPARNSASSTKCSATRATDTSSNRRRMCGAIVSGIRRSMKEVRKPQSQHSLTPYPSLHYLPTPHAPSLTPTLTEFLFANAFKQHSAHTTSAPAPSHASTSHTTVPARGQASKIKSS
jgi:hypothetical protein